MGKPTVCAIAGGFTFWGSNNPIVAADPMITGYWIPTDRPVDAAHPFNGDEVHREATA